MRSRDIKTGATDVLLKFEIPRKHLTIISMGYISQIVYFSEFTLDIIYLYHINKGFENAQRSILRSINDNIFENYKLSVI